MLSLPTVFIPNPSAECDTDYDNDSDNDSISSLSTDHMLEECDALNFCFRCSKLIESTIYPELCTCVSEGKYPQNKSCHMCFQMYNDAQEKCECDYCFDCEKLYDDNYPCDCQKEAISEMDKSFDGTGYNYCYDCCAVINSNTNTRDLCTCIRDGKLPQNVECFDCGERYNQEGEEPCECILEMMHDDMRMAYLQNPPDHLQDKIWNKYATIIQFAWRKYMEERIKFEKAWKELVEKTPPVYGDPFADRIALILCDQRDGKNVDNLIREMITEKGN